MVRKKVLRSGADRRREASEDLIRSFFALQGDTRPLDGIGASMDIGLGAWPAVGPLRGGPDYFSADGGDGGPDFVGLEELARMARREEGGGRHA